MSRIVDLRRGGAASLVATCVAAWGAVQAGAAEPGAQNAVPVAASARAPARAVAASTASNGAAATMATPEAAADPARPASPVSTRHGGTFGGRRLSYDAIVEETLVYDSKGAPAAMLSSFSYVERRARAEPARPVIFAFNGGPGSASIWMHFGLLGPRRVVFADPVNPPTAPPFEIGDNPHSPLDVADVVLIDPVRTGFSRLLSGAKAEDFLGVTQDARATADFIRQWLTRHGRWNSPKFLMGESYGTVRAITLTGMLAGGVFPPNGNLGAISLNGIAILGPALGTGSARLEGNDRGSLSDLPTMAATAWYHGRLGPKDRPVEAAIDAARQFARQDYLTALNAGYLLDPVEKQRIAGRLAELTGVPAGAWSDANLRLPMSAFQTLLLRERGVQVGAYDSRYLLPARPNGNDPVVDDPAMGQYTPGYVAAFNQYLSAELGLHYAQRYVPIAWTDVNFKWDYGQGPGVSVPRNEATELATAMRRNPELRVFIGVGYYDLVTTLGAAEYSLAHSPVARDRLTFKGYASGHMPYIGEDSAVALAADLRSFVRGAVRTPAAR